MLPRPLPLPLFLRLALIAIPGLALGQADQAGLAPLMPRPADHTLMFWADGFPAHTPSAPWHRVIQTGSYAMVLDTETLRIPHLGPLRGSGGYWEAASESTRAWESLPGAELDLRIITNGQTYRCVAGGAWSQFAGPRLIESGRFLQRADVPGLRFQADDGSTLNADARFETVAWPDRLGLIFAARPGLQPIPAGEPCFGHEGGGFGLDGTNHFEVPHAPELDPETFTLELWAYVPTNCEASPKTFPWLLCKNSHEQAEGNYGIVILRGKAQARLNIGGGRENAFTADAAKPLVADAWNHLAISYDGQTLRLHQNGELAGETFIGRKRLPGTRGLAFGRRQDNSGDGYHFRGVIDEIRLHDHALTPEEWKSAARPKPVREFRFAAEGHARATQPREIWHEATLSIALPSASLSAQAAVPGDGWTEAGFCFDPSTWQTTPCPVEVAAKEIPSGSARLVTYDAARAWHRIDLDGVVPTGSENDAMERIQVVLRNPGNTEATARLLFEKSASGIRHRFGAPITGISAVLRTPDGQPTGIPVQLSKNWHNHPEGGVYSGQWFHGISQVRVPPSAALELELSIVYGHWGGVPAASHAQLCLIGWGTNQLWDQSALGSWGESICYEPDQIQRDCSVLDVRPAMVTALSKAGRWSWTNNVGGADFFRCFAPGGSRLPHRAMRTAYERQGPCLTEVTYAGSIGPALKHRATVSLARTDDIVRGIYRLRLDVNDPMPFSRFVIFQAGADSYSFTAERKLALGNESGLQHEWDAQWGGDTYRTGPKECTGTTPWISLHEATSPKADAVQGAWANRGIVIREWKARLGGKPAAPWIAERGVSERSAHSSTVDLIPPPGVTRLEPGDFVEATIEHLIVPQFAQDYYGPNQSLQAALQKDANTWRMVHREAVGNQRTVTVSRGELRHRYPDVRIASQQGAAEFTISGGLGYVPVTITGLPSPLGYTLRVDGTPLAQAVHGNDFWQCDFDPPSATWSLTYNLPLAPGKPHTIQLLPTP